MRRATGWEQRWFEVESFRVITDDDDPAVGARAASPPRRRSRCTSAASASSPPPRATARSNALDTALRQALGDRYPALDHVHLTDYKVRVLDTAKGTGAVTRVLVDSTNGDRTWTTIGVSENIIEASWQALSDSLVYGLLRRRAARSSTAAMPTDPFVAPDARRPSPPGAEPGARRAPAGRRRRGGPTAPATSRPASRPARCSGGPGPNVGYAVTLAEPRPRPARARRPRVDRRRARGRSPSWR